MRIGNNYSNIYHTYNRMLKSKQARAIASSQNSSNQTGNSIQPTRDPNYKSVDLSNEPNIWIARGILNGTYIPPNIPNMAEVDRLSDEIVEDWINNPDRETNYKKSSNWNEVIAQMVASEKILIPSITKDIDTIMKDNGIEIGNDEKFDINVQNGKITVVGEDTEKAKLMEDALNNTDRMNISLHYITKQHSEEFSKIDQSTREEIFGKVLLDFDVRKESNGEVGLNDLRLENGRIVGLPPEVEALYYGTKEGMSEEEIEAKAYTRAGIENMLRKGLENIPDMVTNFTYSAGKITVSDYKPVNLFNHTYN